jgi:predicted dehydrogenase
MSESVNRRNFIGNTAAGTAVVGLGMSSLKALADSSSNNKVVIGVMGLSRGAALAAGFAKQPNVEIKYLCDVDSKRIPAITQRIEKTSGKAPEGITDFRRILDDKSVDALICAAPNHWHAPATILACAAGKNVYVEKPCSHNPREGEMMIEAARKHNRAVQMGAQRRSGTGWKEAIQKLHEGEIGRTYLVRSWYANARQSIGTGKATEVPEYIDYDMWQGPAPRQAYVDNLVHYNWHWRWHWGNGELGNNGVHTLDVCRWGLGAELPTRVTSSGGRYHWQDDQETPDTQTVCFDFGDKGQVTWEGLSCNRHRAGFVTYYGDNGTLDVAQDGSYIQYDKGDKVVGQAKAKSRGDDEHIANFVAAIRNDTPLALNAEIETGHRSTLLCHLGNIAQRTGTSLNCDPTNGHILDNTEAMKLWSREYEPGWEPQV